MRVFVTGGLGFVGRHLCRFLLENQHQVTAVGLGRNPKTIPHSGFTYIAADLTQPGAWQRTAAAADAVVNLAGKSIFGYWTDGYKQQMRASRILTTRNLVQAMAGGDKVLCSASAVGFYGDGGEVILTEELPAGEDFLASLAADWENEARAAEQQGVRVVLARFATVLARDGGALSTMIPAFRLFLGGPLGSGRQWFPWIHISDLVQAVNFVIQRPDIRGPLNFCAPQPVRNQELATTLARFLNRPAYMPAPAFMVRFLLAEFGQALLNSQRAEPRRLSSLGFRFEYPDLQAALKDITQADRRARNG